MNTQNGHTAVANPFTHLIEDGERIIGQLEAKSEDLVNAIDKETAIATALTEAKRHLDLAESEVVMEASFDKENPFAKIAKTSKEYGYAVDNLLGNHPAVVAVRQSVRQLEVEAANAKAEREMADTRWSAVRHVAMLKTAIINATVGR